MSTTQAAIRDSMIASVRGLTPTYHAAEKFRQHRDRLDLRAWAAQNPASCLRLFSVRFVADLEPPTVSDTESEMVTRSIEVVVAYPADGRHGKDLELRDLDDVIEEDLRMIDDTIGTNGFAHLAGTNPGATVITDGDAREDGGAVTFGVLRMRCHYYRSNP